MEIVTEPTAAAAPTEETIGTAQATEICECPQFSLSSASRLYLTIMLMPCIAPAPVTTDGTGGWLKVRSRELRRWVDEAFEDEPESYQITNAVNKITRNVPVDRKNDVYFQSILLRADVPAEHVYTLITLLARQRDETWRKPLPPPTLSVDEPLVADVTQALMHGPNEGTPYDPTEEGALDAAVALYRVLYDMSSAIASTTLAVLADKIRLMGGDRVNVAASLLRRVFSSDEELPPDLDTVRTAVLSQLISRKEADEALEFYEATRGPLPANDVWAAFAAGGGPGTEAPFMAGFSYGVQYAEALREDMEGLVEGARAFEEDENWQKVPLNRIKFVRLTGSAEEAGGPAHDDTPTTVLEEVLERAARLNAETLAILAEDAAGTPGPRSEAVGTVAGQNEETMAVLAESGKGKRRAGDAGEGLQDDQEGGISPSKRARGAEEGLLLYQ